MSQSTQVVQWRPWGIEALAQAQREDKPILLSIGSAACHWCQLMARESFADAGIAARINEGFIAIQVDREERPDLDQIYQQAHQLLRRSPGAWPLTVFLSPQGVPFYCGTYFPPEASAGQAGFRDVLASVSTVWAEQREALARQDQALLKAWAATMPRSDPRVVLDTTLADEAQQQLATAYDAKHGGFGGAPKFAHPSDLAFLLRRGREAGHAPAREMALSSLRQMVQGGLFDQVGGGFFSYSTDAAWCVPHFEKLLGDNAVLLALYAQALADTGEPLFRHAVEATAGWALREMQGDDGAFHAALAAADAQGRPGAFYLWESEALRLSLAPNEWDVCAAHWGLLDGPKVDGLWHLRVTRSAAALAQTLQRPLEMIEALIESARAKLLAERDKRPRPARAAQQPTRTNALMITALARASAACQRADWLQVARRTLGFIRSQRWVGGRLQDGYLDDHACLLEAVLALHEVDPQADDLPLASTLAEALLAEFEDPAEGGFFFTRHDAPPLIHRPKPGLDAATPSGNGTAALALQALGRLLGEPRYGAAAERCVKVFAATVRADPCSHTRLLHAACGSVQPHAPAAGRAGSLKAGQRRTVAILRKAPSAFRVSKARRARSTVASGVARLKAM